LLDRGGTVCAAARAVGVHEDVGYNWLWKTGLTMARAAPRTYPAELKAEFLRLVRERDIISTVAHDLGIHRPTAYAWARQSRRYLVSASVTLSTLNRASALLHVPVSHYSSSFFVEKWSNALGGHDFVVAGTSRHHRPH
jgi:transposase-like protein